MIELALVFVIVFGVIDVILGVGMLRRLGELMSEIYLRG